MVLQLPFRVFDRDWLGFFGHAVRHEASNAKKFVDGGHVVSSAAINPRAVNDEVAVGDDMAVVSMSLNEGRKGLILGWDAQGGLVLSPDVLDVNVCNIAQSLKFVDINSPRPVLLVVLDYVGDELGIGIDRVVQLAKVNNPRFGMLDAES